MMKTRVKKVLAVLLSIAMIIGMIPAMAFADEADAADEGKTVNLLVFGNSTSSGYGMPDFVNRNNGFGSWNNFLEEEYADVEENPNRPNAWTKEWAEDRRPADQGGKNPGGQSRMSNAAYPWQLKKYIAAQEGVDKVNLIPITMNGMRTDELRAFLDKDFYDASSAREYAYSKQWKEEHGESGEVGTHDGFMNAHLRWYFGNFRDCNVIANDTYEAASGYVQNSIKDADVIVVDLCGNNFGTYMGYRLSGFLGIDGFERYRANTYETIDDVKDLPDSLKTNIKSLVSRAVGDNPMFSEGAGKQLLDIYMYSVADCIVNFKANMEWINQNKKAGAKVIAVGLNNPMLGLKIDTGDSEINLGELAGALYSLVNRYMKSFDSNTNNYYYAAVPDDMTTFASSIADAESLEALLADGSYEDGLGAYAIERIYSDFVKQFIIGNTDAPDEAVDPAITAMAENIYNKVTPMVQSVVDDMDIGAQLTFPAWNSLQDNDPITFTLNDFYITFDQEAEEQFGFSAKADDPKVAYKATLNAVAGAMGIGGDSLYGVVQNETKKKLSNMVPGATAVFPEWDNLGDYDKVSFSIKPLYLTYNTEETNLAKAINFSPVEPEADSTIVPLTKGIMKNIVKNAIQEMLYDAVNKHQSIDIAGLVEILANGGEGIGAAAEAITDYLAAKMQGEEADLGSLWGLITIEERFLLSSGVGEHPNAEGCNEKYQAVLDAYLNDNTAYEETKAEVEQLLKELVEMLRQTGARDDIDAIIAKIAEIQDAMEMLDEAQASMEELKEIMELKKQFEEYFQEALDLLGITVDDLIAQGQFIADNVDPVWVAEQIKLMNDIIERWPELQDEYKAKIEEYAEKIADAIDKTIDEIIKQKDAFEDSEAMKKIIETIEVLRDVVDKLPKSEEEFKAMLQEQLEKAEAMIEEAAAAISEDLAEQIKEIRKKIEEAIKKEDYQALIDELLPIGEKLLAIGEAVYNLPEYEAAMQEYLEASDAAMAGLEDRVTELERQAGKLLAKSIDVDLVATPKFGAKTSSIDLTWAADEDAAGYILKVDDKEVEAKETEAGLAYEQANIKVAQTYKYEVTPYVLYQVNGETETIYGRTFKKTYVPKVTLKKATLKKVKAATKSFKATWKKITGVDGYQVNYKLGKKAKNKLVKGEKKTSVKIKKLKKGKKYTVKVRVYKTVNGKKYYGKFSKAKKVKVK